MQRDPKQLDYEVLGKRIQRIRKSKHISQAMLAYETEKTPGYISYLECGTKKMSLDTFFRIANALGVSTEVLLNRQLAVAPEITSIEAQEIFADCSTYETYVLLDVLKALKESTKAQRHHLDKRDW